MKVWNLGYPRIGKENEIAQAVSEFEQGTKTPIELLDLGRKALKSRWELQHDLGVDSIPVNDFSFWDHLLDMAYLFNLIPLGIADETHWLMTQKNLVQGKADGNIRPLTIRRWFNTNYFCFLPQWDLKNPIKLQMDKVNWELECLKSVPYQSHLTLIGPWTLVQLCETGKKPKSELLNEVTPLYLQLLKDLKKKGLEWVQLEEPSFCQELDRKALEGIHRIYQQFSKGCPKIMLSNYYDSPDPWLTDLSELPVQGIHFDLVSGPATLSWIKTRVFPKDKILCLGLINAQNIWSAGLASAFKQIEILKGFHSESKMVLSTSAPLYHLPISKKKEAWEKENPVLHRSVSFADERLEELHRLKNALSGEVSIQELEKDEKEQRDRLVQIHEKRDSVKNQINRIELQNRKRSSSGAKRQKLQSKKFLFPKLPLNLLENHQALETQSWISLQNELEVDVVLTDSRNLDERLLDIASCWKGIHSIPNGWVQKVGSKCYRPLIIAGDVEWNSSSSLGLFEQAKSISQKPAKLSVIGPLSLVSLSFTRSDIPFEVIGNQVALAVRQELKVDESAGVSIFQIDEPNLGAGVPLKLGKKTAFYKSASEIFRLASCGVKDETLVQLAAGQNEISGLLEFLTKIDVDTIFCNLPILTSDTITTLKKTGSETGLGPAIIASSRSWMATEKEVELAIRKAFEFIAPDRLWVSAESGLGFVSGSEFTQSLKNLASITKRFRSLLNNLG